MAAVLALLLAVSTLLPSGVDMSSQDLVFLEVNSKDSEEKLSSSLRDRIIIPEGLLVKELGTSKFFAVLKEPILARMVLKDVNEVTPVADTNEMMRKINITWPTHPDISNTNLTLFKITLSLKGQTLQQYLLDFKHGARTFSDVMKNFSHRLYFSKGSYSPKHYVFINVLDDIASVCKDVLDFFGDHGSTSVETSYVQLLLLAN